MQNEKCPKCGSGDLLFSQPVWCMDTKVRHTATTEVCCEACAHAFTMNLAVCNAGEVGSGDAVLKERDELKRWKDESMLVQAKLNLQAVGRELGVRLGEDIAEQVLPGIRRLKDEIAKATAATANGDTYRRMASVVTEVRLSFDRFAADMDKLREEVVKVISNCMPSGGPVELPGPESLASDMRAFVVKRQFYQPSVAILYGRSPEEIQRLVEMAYGASGDTWVYDVACGKKYHKKQSGEWIAAEIAQ